MDPTSDKVQIANALLNLVGAMFAGYITYLIARLNKKTGVALERAEEALTVQGVRNEVGDRRLDNLTTLAEAAKQTGEAVHVLVNSKMLTQLRISAVALRRVADLTGDPDDRQAAILAEQEYRAQQARQRALDEQQAAAAATPGGVPDVT